jgi:hypothetical protein
VITPDSPERLYSTRLRTAVVLTGSGTAGAYHAGVLRALHEAGVRTDLVAGRGMGAVGAMFAAVDGGSRLWDGSGIWKRKPAAGFYGWRPALRVAGLAAAVAAALLLFPVLLFAAAIVVGVAGLFLTLIGFDEAGSALAAGFMSRLIGLFSPESLPTTVPRLVLLAVLVAIAAPAWALAVQYLTGRVRRRTRAGRLAFLWRLIAAPISSSRVFDVFATELWSLIKGVAPLQRPNDGELARRYIELLGENLGQPGFRELLLVAHDVDARHDVVFAFLTEQHRARFFGRAAGAGSTARSAAALDLAGVARDHAIDALRGALALPVAVAPHLVSFAAEGPWRGESHRLCDRPSALSRLLEEVAAAGVEQVLIVSASPRGGRPHELSAPRGDLRGTAGEHLGGFESADLRDAVEQFAGRFAGLHVIRPEHNPLGPLDFSGVYDERSDRRYTLGELVDRGYEDAYRQFIDPIVGASGEGMHSETETAGLKSADLIVRE